MNNILVVDDERSYRNSLKEMLEYEGYAVDLAESGVEALEKCGSKHYDVVTCAMKMSGMSGLEVLSNLRKSDSSLPVVIISAHGSVASAVECMKCGAHDFIEKPVNVSRLLGSVRSAIEPEVQCAKSTARGYSSKSHSRVDDIIGSSTEIMKVKNMIDRVAPSEARVLITGENGTGKELVARWLHEKSARLGQPFVDVNCAAIPSELIESELFGHEKGAFTSAIKQRKGKFEQAEGGTIFLDEIGDMSLSAQAKVLRVLQEHRISRVGSDKNIPINVRVIAATNKNLRDEIAAHNFREDLYHRLSVVVIEVPPLRERSEDIELLVPKFIEHICDEYHIPGKKISPQALNYLKSLSWSGNIRELKNVVERLIILCGNNICLEDVKQYAERVD